MSPRSLCCTLLALTIATTSGTSRAAEPWFELKDFGPVTQRVAITVENPASVDVDAAVVRLPMGQLRKLLPEARVGQVCVVDPTHTPAKRDRADEEFVPFQVSARTLIFMLPLKAGEKKQVHVYSAPQPLNLPGFPDGTAYDSRHAYRSFENRFAAYRIESGPGANTTGMTIDAFGKTKEGIGLRLKELYQQGHDSYHTLTYWGIDILKVGQGPGLGGAYLYSGDNVGRPPAASIIVNTVYQGPIETKIRMTSPVEVGGKKYVLTRYLTMVANDRTIHDEMVVEGSDLSNVQIGVGVRDLPNCVWVEPVSDKGYGFQTGEANQPGYKAVGLGALFDPKSYVRTVELPEADPGHVYVLKGRMEDGNLVSRHRLSYVWDMDGQLAKPLETAEQLREPFRKWFETWAAQRDNPVKFTVGQSAEKKP